MVTTRRSRVVARPDSFSRIGQVGPKKGQRQCITCGETFTVGEKRDGSKHGYNGHYCPKHDSR